MKDKENVKVMKENGIKVSLRTLQNWKKENGISKRDKVQNQMYIYEKKEENIYSCNCTFGTNENDIVMNYYQKGYTYRQIAEILGISKSKVYRTIKKTAENNQPNTIEIEVVPTINAANEIETKINELKNAYNDDLYFDVYRTIKESLNTETNSTCTVEK